MPAEPVAQVHAVVGYPFAFMVIALTGAALLCVLGGFVVVCFRMVKGLSLLIIGASFLLFVRLAMVFEPDRGELGFWAMNAARLTAVALFVWIARSMPNGHDRGLFDSPTDEGRHSPPCPMVRSAVDESRDDRLFQPGGRRPMGQQRTASDPLLRSWDNTASGAERAATSDARHPLRDATDGI